MVQVTEAVDGEFSFDDAVERITTPYTAKHNWLDEQITKMKEKSEVAVMKRIREQINFKP